MERLLDGREVAQAEHVHLHQAEILDVILVELADDHSFGGYFEGREVGDGIAGDDDSAEVDAEVAGEAVYELTGIEQLLQCGGIELGATQLG